MTTDLQEQAAAPLDENKIIAERRAKLAALRSEGIAFPNDFKPQHKAADLHAQYAAKTREELEAEPVTVVLAGRMMLKREAGKKAAFATLQDASGPKADGRIQIYATLDLTGEAAMAALHHYDLGDILGVTGTLFKTKTDELTIKVTELRLITKSLRPLPDKFHGLADQETKYRQRYVDLIMNEETRRTFKARTAAISSMRRFMEKNEFMEVETPMLHAIPGGAAAKPFITHHNALDMQMYLRIAPELYLKRLVVGGFDRVFEINRNFRNEGISIRHNPEFTMMEFYQAYATFEDLMDFTEELLCHVAQELLGTLDFTCQGESVSFRRPWRRLTVREAILEYGDVDARQLNDRELALAYARSIGLDMPTDIGYGKLLMEIFEEVAEHK